MEWFSPKLIFGLCAGFCLVFSTLFWIAPFKFSQNKALNVAIVSIALSFIVGSFSLYHYYGAIDRVEDKLSIERIANALSQLQANQEVTPEKVITLLKKVETQLPSRSGPWAYLASVYQHLGFIELAASSYHEAYRLDTQEIAYLIQEGYLTSRLNQGVLSAELKTQLNTQLSYAQYKNNPDILTLLSMDAYQSKDYKKAIDYFTVLLNHPLVAKPERTTIEFMLTKASDSLTL